MYTVLLVDDDPSIVNNLQNIIDWPVYGVEHILTAKDGQEAWELVQVQHVDLMITDITMPRMDGLELIRRVSSAYPHIRCILLTSYSDFAYAKEAISLNVENYLLKPVKLDELDYSIRRSLDNLFSHRRTVSKLLLDNVLYRWVCNDIALDELSERSKHIGINVYFRQYCVVLIQSPHKKPLGDLVASFLALIKPRYDAYHFINYDGHHVIILGSHTIAQSLISETFQTIIRSHFCDSDFHVSVGYVTEGADNVAKSYQSALECLMIRPGTAQCITLSNKGASLTFNNLQISQIIDSMSKQLNGEDESWIPNLFQEFFPELQNATLPDLNAFAEVLPARLALQLSSSGMIDANAKDTILNNTHRFETLPSREVLYDWFRDILSICQVLAKQHAKTLSPIISSAMQYVADHYAGYISIKDFSNKHAMNASYLGLLFKKETGIYFNDYLNQLRINHAIHLLKNTNLKVSEICKSSGFTNSSYFILCFRKQTGISPNKFRKLFSAEK